MHSPPPLKGAHTLGLRPQLTQPPPPAPHSFLAVPALQKTPEEQHPAQPLSVSQTQVPPLQRSPAPHGLFAPHLQPPFVQRSAASVSQAAH